MFWQEDEDKTLPFIAPDDVLDVSFAIDCKRLPLDHAWDLAQAIQQALPWFAEESVAGVHPVHVAESGNGWERPDDPTNQFLLPSRRTRLFLRIPKQRIAATQALSGKTLDVGDYPIGLRDMKEKPFIHTSVVFARYVLSNEGEDENSFLQRMAAEVKRVADFKVKKLLCGKSHTLRTPDKILHTRHLMIADLDSDPSIKLQQYGLGDGRKLGCGLFMPHKGIKTLKPTE
ncbi:MAG: type I-MYXAN CRISPR-associated protein Cas6/Cmx6 [Thiothrix litoralis]|jgi:CRISPR-associated protein Cas6